jgi:glycerophosphoryl diester phosphodiesterase
VWDIPLERASVVAHRGAGILAPENTMGALELSWSMGCIPELDVRTTKDGRVMRFHNNNLARILPNAPDEVKKKGVVDLLFKAVKQLDIGSFRGEQFKGQKVLSLIEMVGILKAHRSAPERTGNARSISTSRRLTSANSPPRPLALTGS